LPQPAKWTQLLLKMGLNDSQALEAVKSDSERGEQIRKFVLRSVGRCFVPEAVIQATHRRRKETRPALLSVTQRASIDSTAVMTTSGETM
jgi:hypothetical protein